MMSLSRPPKLCLFSLRGCSNGVIVCLILAWTLVGQTRLVFDVASVKVNLTDDPYTDKAPHLSGNRVRMHNSDLASILAWSYDLRNPAYQLAAHPWEKALFDSYDIDAIASAPPAEAELRAMFQALLEDRFKLKIHRETRELPAYDLVVARNGPKLKAAQPGTRKSLGFGGSSSWTQLEGDGSHLIGRGSTIAELVVTLSKKLGAPVRDHTGIAGTYDYDVVFTSGVNITEAPMLTSAIQELGLKLVKSEGSFDVLVIDRLEKPSSN